MAHPLTLGEFIIYLAALICIFFPIACFWMLYKIKWLLEIQQEEDIEQEQQ